jgi:hypothetical protein
MEEFSIFHWLVVFGLIVVPAVIYGFCRLVKKGLR